MIIKIVLKLIHFLKRILGINCSEQEISDVGIFNSQITTEEYQKAISFFTVSFKFFSLVQNSLQETIFQKNRYFVTSDKEIDFDEYASATKWSDRQIIIPLLFNFYHGLELFLKGLLHFDPSFELKAKHSIAGLSDRFIKNNLSEKELCDFLKKYIHFGKLPELLKDFLTINNLTINKLYEALRYPTDPSFTLIREYLCFKYKGDEGIHFFEELLSDIEKARIAAVSYAKARKPG